MSVNVGYFNIASYQLVDILFERNINYNAIDSLIIFANFLGYLPFKHFDLSVQLLYKNIRYKNLLCSVIYLPQNTTAGSWRPYKENISLGRVVIAESCPRRRASA